MFKKNKFLPKRSFLKYDYTNNIKVIFDSNFSFSSIEFFKSRVVSYYYKYIDMLGTIDIFDVSSFISSLSDKSFLHSISMLEVLFYLSRLYNTLLLFDYSKIISGLPREQYPILFSEYNSIYDFYDFIFVSYCDFKKKSNFYNFVRSLYKSFFSSHSDILCVCVNSNNVIVHFKDCRSLTYSINNDCLNIPIFS